MKLTDPEKLILYMLSEIHERLNIDDGLDPKFVREVISSGNTWALSEKFAGIFENSDQRDERPENVQEVSDILSMWFVVETGYDQLSSEDKERIRAEAHPYGTNVRFAGFDGNEETQQKEIAQILIDDLGVYTCFKNRPLTSFGPTLPRYLRMLKVFKLVRRADGNLTASQIIEILGAQGHPDHEPSNSPVN